MSDNSQTRADIFAAMPVIAEALTALTGVTWTTGDPNHYHDYYRTLQAADGRSFGFYLNTWPTLRFEVSGRYGRLPGDTSDWYPRNNPKIGLSPTKAPKAIAGDIVRRLLADYTTHWQAFQQRTTERTGTRKAVVELTATALGAANGALLNYGRDRDTSGIEAQLDLTSKVDGYGSVRIGSSYIRFEAFSVPPAVGLAMLAALGAAPERK